MNMLTSGVYASTSTLLSDANHDDAVEFQFSFLRVSLYFFLFSPSFFVFFCIFFCFFGFLRFALFPFFSYFSYFFLELQFIFVQMCIVYLN